MRPSSIRKGSQVFRKPAQLDSGKQEGLTASNHGNGPSATLISVQSYAGAYSPHVLPVDQGEGAELDHVPRGAVLVPHQVQRHGNVRVTVIAAEVVLWGKAWGS